MIRSESFDLRRTLTTIGLSELPVVPVALSNGGHRAEAEAILDSGADLSVIPRQLGRILKLRPRKAPLRFMNGIGGSLRYRLCQLPLTIGRLSVVARCAWSDSDDAPFLLGRADVFPAFEILFDGPRHRLHLGGQVSGSG